jgi:U3 small nucleolar RNA-associated protein 13
LNSVLQVSFCSAGMQLYSSGADGLFKLWTVKSNECVGTFDEHEDKVWALKMSKSEKFAVSGGADSKIVVWEDVTQEEAEEEKQIEEKRIIE